ncbi:MAG: thioredoxin family protein [Pseudomonadota bacterium]
MRLILSAIAATLIAACNQTSVAASERAAVTAPAEDTRVLAVLSYAEWCGSCKVLDPKIEAIQSTNTFEGVAFATIDFTSRDKDAFYADAETLGIGETMRTKFGEKIKTGQLFLVALDTGEIVSTIDKSMDDAAIIAAITEASAGA